MGKGDTPRRVNKERYDANFEAIFGARPLPVSGPIHGGEGEPPDVHEQGSNTEEETQ